MRNTLPILFLILSLCYLTSCSTTELTKYSSSNPCFTTLEGKFKSSIPKWRGETPNLLIKGQGSSVEKISGKVIEVKEDGVLFDQKRQSPTYDPEPKFYPKDEIYSFIDSNGELIFGENPRKKHDIEKVKFIFNTSSNDDTKPVSFKAKKDQVFSYCITPGTYTLDRIFVDRGKLYVDKSAKNIELQVDVKSSATNYLGTLYIDYTDSLQIQPSFHIPLKMHNRPKGMVYGVAFGLVGAATYSAKNSGVIDSLDLQVSHDSEYDPVSVKQVHYISIK